MGDNSGCFPVILVLTTTCRPNEPLPCCEIRIVFLSSSLITSVIVVIYIPDTMPKKTKGKKSKDDDWPDENEKNLDDKMKSMTLTVEEEEDDSKVF